jgi:hypothetical protein
MGQEKLQEVERSDDTVQANSEIQGGVEEGARREASFISELGQIIITPAGMSSKPPSKAWVTAKSCNTLSLCVAETGLQFVSDPGV